MEIIRKRSLTNYNPRYHLQDFRNRGGKNVLFFVRQKPKISSLMSPKERSESRAAPRALGDVTIWICHRRPPTAASRMPRQRLPVFLQIKERRQKRSPQKVALCRRHRSCFPIPSADSFRPDKPGVMLTQPQPHHQSCGCLFPGCSATAGTQWMRAAMWSGGNSSHAFPFSWTAGSEAGRGKKK